MVSREEKIINAVDLLWGEEVAIRTWILYESGLPIGTSILKARGYQFPHVATGNEVHKRFAPFTLHSLGIRKNDLS